MPHPSSINPKTGKRYDFVDPRQQERDLRSITAELELLERQKAIRKAREELMAFTQFTMPDPTAPNDITKTMYQAAPFHKAVAKALEDVERGETRQLIFCMPPRHGKTELATKRLSAWYSGRHPEQDIIVAAAGDKLAEDFGGDVRAIMQAPAFRQVFPTHKLRRGGTAKNNIQTTQGGRLIFAGRGGQINGRGAHLLLIDDLYKDHEEARSQTIRDEAWNWFTKVALYRRMGKKLTIITMTRWHSDDIIGRLTDPENPHYNAIEAKAWKIIRLPGLAEEDDPLGRQPGEALWPDGPGQYDVEYHHANQRRDPLGFASLTQQRPSVADGTLFLRENIKRYRPDELPTELRYYAASDHAVATKQRNDPSCFGKVGIDRYDNMYFVDLFWKRVPTDQAAEAMLTMAEGKTAPLVWWAEKGHISQSIGPFLRRLSLETERYLNIREVTPVGDKEQRAQSFAARLAMGKVFFPQGMQWDKAVEELLSFPSGVHDDFVDMCSLLGLGLRSQFGAKKEAPRKAEPLFGTGAWLKLHDKWTEEKRAAAAAGGF